MVGSYLNGFKEDYVKGKAKGKVHPRRVHEIPEGSRGIAPLFL